MLVNYLYIIFVFLFLYLFTNSFYYETIEITGTGCHLMWFHPIVYVI